ncbi:Phosphoglyceromutase [Spraguea lophii 42_110]|uniref:phosphoglycerate mutase (2,3-diphosphoglycerate-independent) n=1 Tax=Spraguea lophii (strain 42_110) TaxID=1358809 RepID=S7XSJ2_SPRLO|nr:Phosphoglyceromutase [Spraguea lophii 42_110]
MCKPMNKKHKVCLVIIDGWGYNEKITKGDAINETECPWMKLLSNKYQSYLLRADGEFVGLPAGNMGNSKVGHITIGCGRVVEQELTFINRIISEERMSEYLADSGIFDNKSDRIHIIGMVSDGGIHSHIDHIKSYIRNLKDYYKDIFIHCISDGRDTDPMSFLKYYQMIKDFTEEMNAGKVVSLAGRYYTMDRNKNYDRTQKAFEMMTKGPKTNRSIEEVVHDNYKRKITDEMFEPVLFDDDGIIRKDDIILFPNFRADRMRQIVKSFEDFGSKAYTATEYDKNLKSKIIFKTKYIKNTLGAVVSEAGLRQVRIAESEKYAHVTYFFNGGNEQPFKNEERILERSLEVKSFAEVPQMSSFQITDQIIKSMKSKFDLIVANYAAPDMVGHTGNYEAAKEAVKITDLCIGSVFEAAKTNDYILIITADHGNVEIMKDENGNPVTKHSTNKVPLIICKNETGVISDQWGYNKDVIGELSDIAPTILDLLEIKKPKEMTGKTRL